ncbi:MAG: polysaccharide pyruvyl transferase family protein [Alphaproteobacteria bacterium]|nr:polysaccharide pyruvyl transferase family protein [Alphaproteobacteria bacterium]
MNQRILMEGYYGKANFGDDVLMLVTYQLLRHASPRAHISLIVGDAQRDYPRTMLNGIAIEKPNRHARYDVIVHGGGGVFFDFTRHGIVRRILEISVQIIGLSTFVQFERVIRRLTGLHRIHAKRRIGLGIGVGTFTKGSPRMLRSAPILAECDALWLRDHESAANLKRFAPILRAELLHGSDLAFLTENWAPPTREKSQSDKPKLGIALRDWNGMDYEKIKSELATLSHDYTLTGFIFDAHHDPKMRALLAPYDTHIWNPEEMSIHAFASQIAAQDGLITSRAHGAICAACMGVPSVILNIEPKMEQVHQMLCNSTQLIEHHQPWQQAIVTMLAISKEQIAGDVALNRTASQAAWSKIIRWLA